jgi:hypothetical protein
MEKSDGERTEGSGDANDQAIAICELSREVDLVTRSALLELDAGDGVAWLDHGCDGVCVGGRREEIGRVGDEQEKRRIVYLLWYDIVGCVGNVDPFMPLRHPSSRQSTPPAHQLPSSLRVSRPHYSRTPVCLRPRQSDKWTNSKSSSRPHPPCAPSPDPVLVLIKVLL